MACNSSLLRSLAGMRLPDLKCWGSTSQAPRLSRLFAKIPEARVRRLARWVKSGPKRPLADVPAIA